MQKPVEPLTPQEEIEMEKLWRDLENAENKLNTVKRIASDAIKKRNAANREFKLIRAKWLLLAERKYPHHPANVK